MDALAKLLDPYRWLIAGVLLLAVVAGGASAWKIHKNGLIEIGRKEVRAEWQAADNDTLREQSREIARLITTTNNLNEAYREQSSTIDSLERTARAAGVRVNKAQRDAAIANGSAEAVRIYAGVSGDVYQACRDEYRALGYDAARGSATAHTLKQWVDMYPPAKEFDDKLTTFTNTLKGQ
jgi:hypothetical protein